MKKYKMENKSLQMGKIYIKLSYFNIMFTKFMSSKNNFFILNTDKNGG